MINSFSEELFLTNETGRMLYHRYAEHLPIIDYHCHLQPSEILENKEFDFLILPRTNHNVPANPYFIRKKMDYFVKHLLGEEPPKSFEFE